MRSFSTLLLLSFLSLGANAQCAKIVYLNNYNSDIQTALDNVGAGGTVRLMAGYYLVHQTLNMPSDVTLEGGFISSGSYPNYDTTKTSLYGATTINKSSAYALYYPTGSQDAHYIAIRADNKQNFRIQDLKVKTVSGYVSGSSKYGIYLNGCSNYKIVRVGMEPGNGGNGAVPGNGANGVDGMAGSTGGSGGGVDWCDPCLVIASDPIYRGWGGNGGVADGMPVVTGSSPGGSRGAGSRSWAYGGYAGYDATISGIGGNGGGGGHGGGPYCGSLTWYGSPFNSWHCPAGVQYYGGMPGGNGGVTLSNNIAPVGGEQVAHVTYNSLSACTQAGNGDDGEHGVNGAIGIDGITGADLYFDQYVVKSANGQTGLRGAGGSGGAGGGGQTSVEGLQIANDPNNHDHYTKPGSGGGGGGAGGTGGFGGAGGKGGGSSIGLYLFNNGQGGEVINCYIYTGSAGLASPPGLGGTGGTGGAGGIGGIDVCSPNQHGGYGGNGGNGGKGGNGGASSNGDSTLLVRVGGLSLVTSEMNFNLANQAVIVVDASFCMGANINLASTSAANWNFSSATDAVPQLYNALGNTANVVYSAAGRKTISNSLSPNAYTDFVNMQCFNTYYTMPDPISICWYYQGPSGKYFETSGSHTDTIANAAGCDSIVSFTLTVEASAVAPIIYLTFCDDWTDPNGNLHVGPVVNSGTEWWVTLPNGCTQTQPAYITITHGDALASSITRSACDQYEAPDGQIYTASGIYTATIPTTQGCDSVITIDLTISSNYIANDNVEVVACNSYVSALGNIYTSSAVFTEAFTSANGCDSIVTIDLNVIPTTTITTVVFSCEPFESQLSGLVFASSGMYTDTLYHEGGQCYSLEITDLTIGNTVDYVSLSQCSYTLRNGSHTYYDSGTYYDVGPTLAGCDSLLVVDLTSGTTYGQLFVTEFNGSYTVPSGDETYTVEGIYYDTIPNTEGCNHILEIYVGFEVVTGIDTEEEAQMTLYPNPVLNSFNLEVSEQLVGQVYEIVAIDGRVIAQGKLNSLKTVIDISDSASGIYHLVFRGLDASINLIKE